ncbi:MAG: tape measure protein [Solitalea-like symbiont of Tyrophagus putrescentiae]
MAENIEGSLVFKSSLDNTDFNKNISELEDRIRNTRQVTLIEGDRIESALKKIGAGILSYFSVSNLQSFTAHLIKVRSEFQNTEASLKVFLGSGLKAKEFMKELQDYAIDNVFEFKDLAKVSTQLLAYGNDISTVIPILEQLSNIASGTNQPLEDLANLYNKAKSIGKLMTVDLQQWQRIGVPIVQEMAKEYKTTEGAIWEMASTGSISFSQIEKVLRKLTSSGGMFFGMMKEKMGNLGDTVGQLKDSLTKMFNEVGEYGQDYLKGGLLGINTLVENYKEIGKVLLSISMAYGSYRAAIVLNNLATKQQTGISLIDNTVKQAKLALLKAEASLTGANAAIQAKMTAAELANTSAIKAKLTLQEQENLLNKLKTQTLQAILTTEQQQYLSNLKLTKGSREYSRAAMEVLSVEQKQYLKKADLTENSRDYIRLLKQEVSAKEQSGAASLEAMRSDVKAAAVKLADDKARAMTSIHVLRAAEAEVVVSKRLGDATRLQRAEKNLLLVKEEASITRKAALAAHTDFLTKKKTLETAASRQSALASNVDTVSKTGQSTATTLLSTATNKASLAVRTLWASMKANPIGWLVSLVGLAVSAFTMFSKKKEEILNVDKQINDQVKEELGHVTSLVRALEGAKDSTYLRKQVIEKMNPLLSKHHIELIKEGDALGKIVEQYGKLETAITANNVAMLKEQEIKKINKATNAQLDELAQTTQKEIEKSTRKKAWDGSYSKTGRAVYKDIQADWAKGLEEKDIEYFTAYLKDLAATLQSMRDDIEREQQKYDKQKKKDPATLKKINDLKKKHDKTYKDGLDGYFGTIVYTAKSKGASGTIEELMEKARAALYKPVQKHLDSSKAIYDDQNKKVDDITSLKGFDEVHKRRKPKTQKSEEELRREKELAQKQLDATLKLEQSRIEVMEEGYEKRVAQATFQHQQNIEAINKEEADLQKLYKANGSKMPEEDKADFAERRVNEEALLNQQKNALFNDELEYKKHQYELYYKWVEHLGEQTADNQFADLLKNGDSYKQFIENSIASLEQKKASGVITQEELNRYIKLSEINNNINGKVSPLDAFTNDLQQQLSSASNLGEELEVILQKKKDLEEGKSGITNPQQLEAAKNMLDAEKHEKEKQLQQKLLTDFKTYQEKKLSIEKYYAALLEIAEKEGNAGRMAEVKKAQETELSALNASQLMETEAWKNLFSDLDSLSVDAINKLINDIEAKMGDASFNMDPADMKAILDRLNEAKAKLVEKSPFAALGYALTEIFRQGEGQSKKTAAQVQSDWANLALATKGSFGFVHGIISDSVAIKNLLGDSAEDVLNGIHDLDKAMQGAATLGASLASGNVFGVIAGGLQLLAGVADFVTNIFTGDNKKEDKIQNLQKGLQGLQRDYDRLGKAIETTYTNKSLAMMDEQDANLRMQQEQLKQMAAIEEQKKRPDRNKISEWEQLQQDIDDKIADSHRKRQEMLAGTDVKSAIDQFGDALVEAYLKGENAAEKLGEVTKNVMKKAVVDAIKRQFLAKGIEEAVNYLGQSMSDGVLSESERERFQSIVNAAGERTQAALESLGGWIKDPEARGQDALSGSIKNITEETASALAGRLNQVVLYQTDGLSIMRQALIHHAETAANTRNIAVTNEAIRVTNATLKRIEDKINSNPLLSQGIS